jgi:hypothetical protein
MAAVSAKSLKKAFTLLTAKRFSSNMKNTYIIPESVIVELGTRNHLMNVSIVEKELADGSNVGLVKEETSVTDKSLWDEEW